MRHTDGANAPVIARVWQVARRRPKVTFYILAASIFLICAAMFSLRQERNEKAQEAFQRSPEGRAQAAARDQMIADKVDLDLAPELVKARLRDPDSAQFLNVHIVRRNGNKAVCGYVDSRNGFGGMAGGEAFAVFGSDVVMANDASRKDLKRLDSVCYDR